MFSRKFKDAIQNFFLLFGVEIRKVTFWHNSGALIIKCLQHYEIDTVIDVGSNVGQYGIALRKGGYRGKIVSFEPLRTAYQKLQENSAKYGNWDAFNYGVGANLGRLTINVSENLESSSFLKVTALSTAAAPESGFSANEEVEVVTLDQFFRDHPYNGRKLYLKLDVQGFELEVLKGAKSVLSHVAAIQIEMSFVRLYESGPLFTDILAYMDELGFEVYSILPDFRDPTSGRMLQADGIFIPKRQKQNGVASAVGE